MVVGREDEFQELKEKLRSSNSVCKMIFVVGEAGVGKTTVAKKIYNDMRNEFTSSALLYVSNEPRIKELLHEIAKQDGLEEEKIKENLKVNLLSLLNEKRNLIQDSKRYLDGRAENCLIHDLLRILFIEMANENNFSSRRNIHSNSFSTLRRLTIDDTSQFSFSNSKTPKLRTLLCFCNSGEGWSLIPNEIGNLSSLTYLKLRGKFRRMPSTIRNLKKLVTLDIGEAYFYCALPITIFRMKYLKHLLLSVSRFESNRCTNLNVRNDVYLPNIVTLHWVPGTILKASSLQKHSNLRELSLYDINDQHINVISGKTPISEKLQDLYLWFTQKFKRLNLSHYDHLVELFLAAEFNFPFTLDTIEFPPNLIYLTLSEIEFTEDPMKALKKLPRLEILRLIGCTYSQSITLDFTGANSFPELQVLAIEGTEIERLLKENVITELIVNQTGMPKLCKFVCNQDDLNVPERLREIMVEP